jgi:hypothetical protein
MRNLAINDSIKPITTAKTICVAIKIGMEKYNSEPGVRKKFAIRPPYIANFRLVA